MLVGGGRGDIGDLTRQVICCSWALCIYRYLDKKFSLDQGMLWLDYVK